MFNLQGSEIVIVLLLALVVLGPEKLPDAMRRAGQFYAELKKMSSGFQSEFRSAIDEPMREIKDTANMLRDSADFTKLQDGEREEKPKTAEMAPVSDPGAAPADPHESFAGSAGDGIADEPRLAADSRPAPFSGTSSTAPRTTAPSTPDERTGVTEVPVDDPAGGDDEPQLAADSKPAPFSRGSSAAPRPAGTAAADGRDEAASVDAVDDELAADESAAATPPSAADDATGRAR